jgi:hypothetical protein
MLEQLALDKITYFELDNPLLPIKTPVSESKYWYIPGQFEGKKKATN